MLTELCGAFEVSVVERLLVVGQPGFEFSVRESDVSFCTVFCDVCALFCMCYCRLVNDVCYILSQLDGKIGNAKLGIYRDDGLVVSHGTPRQIENVKKKICEIFAKKHLKITIEANKKSIDYLDLTLNLETGKHAPYLKPGNIPQYVNTKSNHPPAVIRSIPEGVNKRLSEISSDENTFKRLQT